MRENITNAGNARAEAVSTGEVYTTLVSLLEIGKERAITVVAMLMAELQVTSPAKFLRTSHKTRMARIT